MTTLMCRPRLSNWEAGFANVCKAWEALCHKPVSRLWMNYGDADCATFCADMVQGVWGVDPIAPLRGAYSTRKKGLALLGTNTLVQALNGLMRPLKPHLASRGDVVVYVNSIDPTNGAHGLAIQDHTYLITPTRGGMAMLTPPHCLMAFTLDLEA